MQSHDLEEENSSNKHSPDSETLTGEMRMKIKQAIAGLSPDESEIVFLHFFEEMKYREIHKITGMPVGTIKYKMSLVKQKLHKALKEYVL